MRALVLPGGGAKGAFQVGAIYYMTKVPQHRHGFSFVSGTSVGALNALAIAAYPPGPEQLREAFLKLKRVWGEIQRSRDIWKLKFPPYVAGLWSPSVGKVRGLEEIVKRHIEIERIRDSGVQLRINAVDLLTGESRWFTEQSEDLIEAVLASASFPLAFPPRELGEDYLIDGGVSNAYPFKPAVDAGATHITCIATRNPWEVPVTSKENLGNTLQVGYRCLLLMEHALLKSDLKALRRANKRALAGKTRKRFIELDVIYPKSRLGSALNFGAEHLERYMLAGVFQAKSFYRQKA